MNGRGAEAMSPCIVFGPPPFVLVPLPCSRFGGAHGRADQEQVQEEGEESANTDDEEMDD